ncbi:NAC domain-containing protein 86-like isoform X1 [Pistacia vera]|uniref:NAC domain-containing protein 86-like isoform X1 n=1 Tax=Pistacia vera TaxID=55513 RepID=UPI0012632CE1|nr:NAC domain-containing protein 86-like isoform X1 [Pistacia vera]
MGSLVGLMYHLFRVKIITLLTEKRVHPDLFVPEINEVDIYQFDPYDLPALSETKSDDQVWYFFCEPHYKYANSKRAHRATGGGNWKITGRGCDVKDKGRVIGKKRTLVFCRRGSTSKEIKTDWVMHEFYIEDSPYYEKNFVVCYIEKTKKNKSSVSTPDDGQPSHSLSSHYESRVTENSSSEVESQQTMSQHLISDSRKHITENSFLDVESPPLSSDELESIYSMINPQPPDEFDAVSGYNWLNHSSVSALQSPINQYQGSNSSYSNGISNDCNLGSYEFTGGLEDVVNSQRNVQNQYPCEVVLTQSDIEAMVKELS